MPEPKTYRCGKIKKGRGLFIGATRYLPRGVSKADLSGYFDVWFPLVAPSAKLIKEFKGRPVQAETFKWFGREYKKELSGSPEARHLLELLARVAERLQIHVGCYCEDEGYCHRGLLRDEITRRMVRRSLGRPS
jgi:uncharacterized protein YeaO (DUF488 family)